MSGTGGSAGSGRPVPARATRRPRVALRTRLVLIFSGVFAGATALTLLATYLVVTGYLETVLDADALRPIARELGTQLLLSLVGTTLLAAGLGWLAARRMLSPVAAITRAARRASEDNLGERLRLDGPEDELRALADTFDAMLDRFQESIETQRRFIANASHELRSPLTAVRTEVDVTLADPAATLAELRAMGERVREGTEELDRLLAALMVLARAQRGLVRRDLVDLAELTELTAADAGRQAEASRVRLDVEPAAGAAPVLGDRALLRRLVANLLDNAIRYHRPGGTVLVQVRVERPDVVLRVVNLGGSPVPPAEVERLRQPFERLGRHGAGGSGLGLSIVQAIAEAGEGTVELAAPDAGGLEVTVRLPAARQSAGQQRQPETSRAPSSDRG